MCLDLPHFSSILICIRTTRFTDFCESFTLRYIALYPDPPKVLIEAAIARWKIETGTVENPYPRPSVYDYDRLRNLAITGQSDFYFVHVIFEMVSVLVLKSATPELSTESRL